MSQVNFATYFSGVTRSLYCLCVPVSAIIPDVDKIYAVRVMQDKP